MKKRSILRAIWNAFGYWEIMFFVIGLVSGVFLYAFHGTEIASIFIIIVVAFIVSDLLAPVFMRGGKGICQISLFGTHTVKEGYGFLFFFIMLLVLSLLGNFYAEAMSVYVGIYLADFWVNLGIGFAFSGLAYFDLHLKFYRRGKK